MRRTISALLLVLPLAVVPLLPSGARADHRDVALAADPVLIESGLMKFLLPRFSLKTGIGVHLGPTGGGAVAGGLALRAAQGGLPVLRGAGRVFAVFPPAPEDPAAARLVAWLVSDIGQRTIEQFRPANGEGFSGAAGEAPAREAAELTGDPARGETLAYDKCGRCHVIGARNRMKGIGSTPSFAVLRSISNWRERFAAFYALNPHPSFSQVEGITPPFDISRPPPIWPLSLTPAELDDIIAYTDGIAPADLGKPLVHQ